MATAEKKKRAKAGYLTKILILALMVAMNLIQLFADKKKAASHKAGI